ncbi:T9SS type A sorting domain-containing protein, partial [bacterium]|nr:T9SS type A sorting domain-containing protein [bacterium]
STPGLMGMQDQDQQWEPELDEGPYLVLHTTDIAQSLQRALNELEVEDVTYINTTAWNGMDFEGYNTIMIGMDGGIPTAADFNLVFDWCRAGGTLMLFGGTNWADAYNAMNDFCHHSGQQGWAQSAPPHINFEDGHPLNEGLEDGTTFANNGASYYMFRFDDEEMEVASTNGDGWPNILTKDVDNGTFICFTSSAASTWWTNQQDYEVYVQIVENCLNYAGGGGWLTVEPEEGYLEVGEETDLDVLVDAVPDSLLAGVYEALVDFNVQYPDTLDPVTVWVTLTVNGGPPHHQWVGPLMPNYFELVSTYLDPVRFNPDAADVFGGLMGLNIVYQDNGNIYIPEVANTIGDLDVLEGYRIFVDEPEQVWHVMGDLMDSYDYMVEGGQWNWIGYPFDYMAMVENTLGGYADDITIIMDDEGNLWIPGLINTMGAQMPGDGYMIFTDDDMTINYTGLEVARAGNSDYVEMPEVEGAPQATGLPYAVIVSLSEEMLASEAAVIELYDGNTLVGKSVVLEDSEVTPVIAWGGDTDKGLAGFAAGNEMSIVVRNASGSKMPLTINGDAPVFGKGAYASVSLEQSAMPTEFAVKQGYPNPFNPSITVPFALPAVGEVNFTVFNVLGQQVFKSGSRFEAGYHRFLFDATANGSELVSGVYFLQVEYQGQMKTQKLMLLK